MKNSIEFSLEEIVVALKYNHNIENVDEIVWDIEQGEVVSVTLKDVTLKKTPEQLKSNASVYHR